VFGNAHDLSKIEKMHLLYAINGWQLPANRPAGMFPMRQQVHEAICLHRSTLGLALDERIGKRWLKAVRNQSALLRYNILVCRYCEAINNPENPVKLFNVVPICKMKRHFVAIDTWSLFGIMKEVGLVHGNSKDFVDLADDHWRSLFKIEKLQGKDNKFAQSIESDGISLCVHFQRPKPAASETHADTFKVQPDDVVVGNDPGRINIFYMVVPLESGFKTYVLTRRQYYSESGINKVIKRSNTWNQAVKTQLDALSCVSTKGVSVDAHLAYLEVYRSHREALWDEYLRPRWARQRLSTYAGKQRVFARFFNRVNKELREAFPDKRIVIAYGSAKFASGGPNEVSVLDGLWPSGPPCGHRRAERIKNAPLGSQQSSLPSSGPPRCTT
jgi:hypothetical protein